MRQTLADIETAVCARFGLTRLELMGMRRARAVARPRQIAMFLAREMTGLSLPRLGTHFARDHTTILHAVRRITRLMEQDTAFAREVEGCRELLSHSLPPSVRHAGKPATAHLPPSAASRSTGRSSTGASANGLTGRKLVADA